MVISAQPTTSAVGSSRPSALLALPDELLSQVAFFCALSPTPGPPAGLVPLLCTHPRLAACLSADANPSLYGRILRSTWDLAAVRRRYGPAALADVRAESAELKRRWSVLQTVRALGDDVGAWLAAHDADGERLLEETMLEVILLLMENDGLNLPHILGWARLPQFVFRLYEAVMLSRSLEPGFPVDSASHACHCMLTMWLLEAGENLRQETLSLGQEAAAETEEQTQEKAFILRPLVFSPQYSLFVAPWNIRSLPQIGCDVDRGGRQVRHLGERTAAVSSTDNTLAQPVPLHVVRRLGREWEMKPPKLGRAAIFGLLNSLDLDPSIGGVTTSASNSSTSSLDFLYTPEELAMDVPGRTPDFDPISHTYLRQSVPILGLRSASFDNDWRRMTLCKSLADRGMTVAHWRGKFEGTWIGSFAYFDFNGFADVLAGDQEAIYTNAFGQQANHIQLTETVVYVPRSKLGGTGTAFMAGYPAEGEDVSRPCPIEEEALDDEPDSEWVKELLVTGTGRSKWGKFTYRGRVRAWDGLLSVEKRYEPNDEPVTQAVSAKWLYRGYVMSDCRWIGKWRDTYTDEATLGYEGPFCLRRQSEPYLLPRRQPYKTGPSVKVHPPARTVNADPSMASRARPMDVASFERAMRGRNAASGEAHAGPSSSGGEARVVICDPAPPTTESQITAMPQPNLWSVLHGFPGIDSLTKEPSGRARAASASPPPTGDTEESLGRPAKRLRPSSAASDDRSERSLSPSVSLSSGALSSSLSAGSGSPGRRRITIASLLSPSPPAQQS